MFDNKSQNITIYDDEQDLIFPGRMELLKDLKQSEKAKGKHPYTLIHISVDNYHDISDYFGIDVSKELMLQLSFWLKARLLTRNTKLYRFEMDKFAIFLSSRTTIKEINNYVNMLISNITKQSFYFDERLYNLRVSIGVARGRVDLFKRSYLALNHVLKTDKSYFIYNPKDKVEEKFLNNIRMHQQVKDAIEQGRVMALFQPIYDPKSNQIVKYEALIRIINTDGTYIMPDSFLDIAKQVRLYTQLTKIMIDNILEKLLEYKKPVSINLSMEDINSQDVRNYIFHKVKESKLAELITFEIVETKQITSYVKILSFMRRMRSIGCKFALDDFGSGFSNFEYLLKLDIDYLKIDGSLIKNINYSKKNEALVQSVISFAQNLGMKTIAEYVSTKAIYDKVNSLGVDYMQGYYIGRAKSLSWYNG